ncbi:MAG: LptF/LptG family permease [bacterium]|nr:LptF/LptG family permease [bacterium]
MKIADKYIMKEFVLGLLWSLLALVIIYIIVDVFENVSTFVDKKVALFTIIQYYVYQIPWIVGTIVSPIACLLGCFISIGNLSRHFELVALKSFSLNTYRTFVPLSCIGLIFSGLILGMNEILLPISNQKMLDLKSEKIDKLPKIAVTPSTHIYYSGEDSRFYRIKFIDPNKGIIKGLTIYEFLKSDALKRRVDAPQAVWEDNQWKLFNGAQQIFKPHSFEVIYFDSLIVRLKETPLDFVKGVKPALSMGFFEFKEHIKKLQKGGEDITKELVDLYSRISFPFMNLIILLLGFPLASRVRNIGFVVGFAIALFVSFIYWGLLQLAKAFGHVGILSPFLASLLPNIIFIIIGTILLWNSRK